MPIFEDKAAEEFDNSLKLTAPLATIMILQGDLLPNKYEANVIRTEHKLHQTNLLKHKADLTEQNLPDKTRKAVQQAKEKGASNWLSVLPLQEQGFTLNKGEFRDAVALRYNHDIRGLPSKCPCGQKFDQNHALNCKRGGFVIIRHNNIRDFNANLLRQVCNDVEVEPALQPVDGEQVRGLAGDDVRADIRARGLWRKGQNAFFDVRLTNCNSTSQTHLSTDKIYAKHESEKKRMYNDRIMNIEHGTITPLVYLNGGAGPECAKFHKHVAEQIATKSGERYEKVLTWIRLSS